MTASSYPKLSDPWNICPEAGKPVLLFQEDEHAIYRLGSSEKSVLRTNTYLVKDGDQGILIDPGGKHVFREIRKNISGLMPMDQLIGMIFSYQDPDVAAFMEKWLELKPDLWIFATLRTHLLLPYYCRAEYRVVDVEKEERFQFNSGNELLFIPSPFLHCPGAVTTLDSRSGYLFSGDVWAAPDPKDQFVVDNFIEYTPKMDLFHKDYMPSNFTPRGYAESLNGHRIHGILPQHGAVIPGRFVEDALDYLKNIECGLDTIYPLIDSFSIDGCDLYEVEKFIDPGDDSFEPGVRRSVTILQNALNRAAQHCVMRDRPIRNLRIVDFFMQKNETRFKEAEAIAHFGHWGWDVSSGDLQWSDEIYRIFGHTVQEIKPTYGFFLQRVHPDDKKMLEDVLERATDEHIMYNVTFRIIRSNKEIRTVHARWQVQRERHGKVLFMLGTAQDITDFSTITHKLAHSNMLIAIIQQMQFRFIQDNDVTKMYNQLLNDLLRLTESSYGFIGDVLKNPEGEPYLVVHTFTNLVSTKESEDLYEKVKGKGLEFHNLDNLFGGAITTRKPVISNDPANDPRSRGLPPGHPELHSLLAVPVMYGNHVVGIISLANRKRGYSEYILEYLDPLITALAQVIVARQDHQTRIATEKILEEEAKLDGLLAIPNRRYFNEYIELQIKKALRGSTPISVVMIDVDFFKYFNDFYGHQKGDQCLIELARIMQGSLHRSLDIVARYGGEEFCCILPDTSENGAMQVAKTIQNRLAQQAMPHNRSQVSNLVTVSQGVASWEPGLPGSPDDLVVRADKALYEAKQSGRNRIVLNSI